VEKYTFKDGTASFAFSPNGKYLALGVNNAGYSGAFRVYRERDCFVKMWDLEQGIEKKSIYGFINFINALCFSSDSKRLLTVSVDHKIKLLDVENGNELKSFYINAVFDVKLCRFSPDEKWFITVHKAESITSHFKVWDAEKGVLLYDIEGIYPTHDYFINDGKIVVIGQSTHCPITFKIES